MAFQIERACQLYAEALPGIRLLNPDGRFAVTAAGMFYQAILEDIEEHDYDVFQRRARVSEWGKIRRLFGIFASSGTRDSRLCLDSNQRLPSGLFV